MAIPKTEIMSEEGYRQFSLSDPQGQWELVEGRLRERPGMSVAHGRVIMDLAVYLANQLARSEFRVRTQHARLRVSPQTYYIPDIAVIPTAIEQALLAYELDAYPGPLPLVVEIWSPSTGDYDISAKVPGYQQRGDLEIWRIHPFERTLTAWRRQPNGAYVETIFRGGLVRVESLPGVTIDLDALFAE
jgi:Uma2 family endonuclease